MAFNNAEPMLKRLKTAALAFHGLWQHLRFLSHEYFYHDWLHQQ
jgi:hypothetical protein